MNLGEAEEIDQLKAQIADKSEALFLCLQDLEKTRTENIAMTNFIQNLYESYQSIDGDSDLTLEQLLKNQKENIRVFSKDHNIRL